MYSQGIPLTQHKASATTTSCRTDAPSGVVAAELLPQNSRLTDAILHTLDYSRHKPALLQIKQICMEKHLPPCHDALTSCTCCVSTLTCQHTDDTGAAPAVIQHTLQVPKYSMTACLKLTR